MFIFQVKTLYFCEFCNVTLPTAMKVELHVHDCDHIKEKSLYKICRINNRIVASGCITIQDDAWHGLVDENCVICSVEISEKEPHITSRNHILNLIKNNVLFDKPGTVYRQVNKHTLKNTRGRSSSPRLTHLVLRFAGSIPA